VAVAVGAAPAREQREAVAGIAAQVPGPAQAYRVQEEQGQQQGPCARRPRVGGGAVIAQDGRVERGEQVGLVGGGEEEQAPGAVTPRRRGRRGARGAASAPAFAVLVRARGGTVPTPSAARTRLMWRTLTSRPNRSRSAACAVAPEADGTPRQYSSSQAQIGGAAWTRAPVARRRGRRPRARPPPGTAGTRRSGWSASPRPRPPPPANARSASPRPGGPWPTASRPWPVSLSSRQAPAALWSDGRARGGPRSLIGGGAYRLKKAR